ncbi:HNH endonuclease [Xanthobacter wiegelii]|uniref:HNH endonuclease n=1 Tax=Xanthobacter wiegelii TaxID=3119913 RepID=UPI003735BECA
MYVKRPKKGRPVGGSEANRWIEEFISKDTHSDECVEWPFSKITGGYGVFTKDYVRYRAHRVVCEAANGPPESDKLDAAHSCGNRLCVNPKHLRWATRKENCADRLIHGTENVGERNGQAKLTERDVREIRALLDSGVKRKTVADRFHISLSHLDAIRARTKWAYSD